MYICIVQVYYREHNRVDIIQQDFNRSLIHLENNLLSRFLIFVLRYIHHYLSIHLKNTKRQKRQV